MKNYLNPQMIAREAVRLIPHLTGRYNTIAKAFIENEGCRYDGVICNIRCYMNDANFYFDIYFDNINFTISFPMFDDIWELSIDDFAEHKLIPELYAKLDQFGYATWD